MSPKSSRSHVPELQSEACPRGERHASWGKPVCASSLDQLQRGHVPLTVVIAPLHPVLQSQPCMEACAAHPCGAVLAERCLQLRSMHITRQLMKDVKLQQFYTDFVPCMHALGLTWATVCLLYTSDAADE